uniref:FBA_2 domain-containing protein n=2 Tax=Caenorhabditis tropicalis TaxID=1561998 RepID=A0A1I7UDV1_9PELO
MNSKPFSYDSLKTVIQYMEPNTRFVTQKFNFIMNTYKFLLSSRAPSILTADKAVPLKIDELEFGSHYIRVNRRYYYYALYQVDCKDKVLRKVGGYNTRTKRFPHDVDEFGIPDYYINEAGGMLPGNNRRREENLFGDIDLENIPTAEGRFEIHIGTFRNFDLRVIERVEYTGDLKKAAYSLMKFMFAKRRHIVQVNTLKNTPPCPINLKMRFKHIFLGAGLSLKLKRVKPIIDESSLPLEKLTIVVNHHNVHEMDQEIIRTAKILDLRVYDHQIFSFVQIAANMVTEYDFGLCGSPNNEDFIDLIKNWVETDRSTGTCFTFKCYDSKENSFIQFLNHINERIDGAVVGNRCVDIPMNNFKKLKISYEELPSCEFQIKMTVVTLE